MTLSSENNNKFRKIIIEHYRNSQYKLVLDDLEAISYEQESTNCADKLIFQFVINNNIITKVGFNGYGCTIAIASSDIFCKVIMNKTMKQTLEIINNYSAMINSQVYNNVVIEDLVILEVLANHTIRKKCALLVANGFKTMINNYE